MRLSWLLFPLAGVLFGGGLWLGRRYDGAIHHAGIGRARPITHSALAFAGNALVIVGLIVLMIAIMVSFV